MNKSLFALLFSTLVCTVTAANDTQDLVKVTPANNPSCVEYFDYHGEMYCRTNAKASTSVDAHLITEERINIPFDDRPWQIAWAKKTAQILTIEYVSSGDNIDHWNELITTQFLPGLQKKVTPEDYAAAIIKQLKETDFNPTVKILEKNPNLVIFEFSISSPGNEQDEIQLITADDNGMYVLHYVIKKTDMGDKSRQAWLLRFKSMTIK